MLHITLSLSQVQKMIDQAFDLGKAYTLDELDTRSSKGKIPTELVDYYQHIEQSGGYRLNSDEAKTDIIREILSQITIDSMKDWNDSADRL